MNKNWIAATGGDVPDEAPAYGRDGDGSPLFIARASIEGGVHPGKVRKAFGAANIPYGGKEVKAAQYEVYVGPARWEAISSNRGETPLSAMKAGYEKDGSPLYVARAEYAGGLHLGKVRLGFKGANIPYGGKEVFVTQYEVLVA